MACRYTVRKRLLNKRFRSNPASALIFNISPKKSLKRVWTKDKNPDRVDVQMKEMRKLGSEKSTGAAKCNGRGCGVIKHYTHETQS